MNIGIRALAALIPLIIGFVWYNPKVFGKAWMRAADLTDEKLKTGNMLIRLLVTYALSFLMALFIQSLVIHQSHVSAILINEPGMGVSKSEIGMLYDNFMSRFGTNFRSFKHGALHGTITGIVFVTPIIAINAMFERRKFKYIAINAGYWIVSLALMGGVICAYIKL